MDNKQKWSWCLHCERAFLSEKILLTPSPIPGDDDCVEECPFLGCDGAGYGFNLYFQAKHYGEEGMRPECWPAPDVEPVEGNIYALYKREEDEYAEKNSGIFQFKPRSGSSL